MPGNYTHVGPERRRRQQNCRTRAHSAPLSPVQSDETAPRCRRKCCSLARSAGARNSSCKRRKHRRKSSSGTAWHGAAEQASAVKVNLHTGRYGLHHTARTSGSEIADRQSQDSQCQPLQHQRHAIRVPRQVRPGGGKAGDGEAVDLQQRQAVLHRVPAPRVVHQCLREEMGASHTLLSVVKYAVSPQPARGP